MAKQELLIEIKAEIDSLKKALNNIQKDIEKINVAVKKGSSFKEMEKGAAGVSKELDKAKRKIGEVRGAARQDPFRSWTESITYIYGSFLALRELLRSNPFSSWVRAGIGFNRTIEDTRLAIAGILASVAQFEGAADKAENFRMALQVAAQLQEQLRTEATKSTATYQELVSVLQGITAPFLSAGGSIQELVSFTVLLTNATKLFGLDLNQAVQESRDLLQGTIDMNSQLARSLGITNEMVKSWQSQGILIQKIRETLSGISQASQLQQQSLTGLLSNLRDAFDALAGEATKGVFGQLKKDLKDIFDYFMKIKGNKIEVNPQVKETIREINERLVDTYNTLKLILKSLKGLYDEFGGIAKVIAQWFLLKKGAELVLKLVIRLKNEVVFLISLVGRLGAKALEAAGYVKNAFKTMSAGALALRAGLAGLVAYVSYNLGKELFNKIDETTKGLGTYIVQNFINFVHRALLELRKSLSFLPGVGISEEEYRQAMERIELIKKAIENEYKAKQKASEPVKEEKRAYEELNTEIEKSVQLENVALKTGVEKEQRIRSEIEKRVQTLQSVLQKAVQLERQYKDKAIQLEKERQRVIKSLRESAQKTFANILDYVAPETPSVGKALEKLKRLREEAGAIKLKLLATANLEQVNELVSRLKEVQDEARSVVTAVPREAWQEYFGSAQAAKQVLQGMLKDLYDTTQVEQKINSVYQQRINYFQQLEQKMGNIVRQTSQLMAQLQQIANTEIKVNLDLSNVDAQVQELKSKIPSEITVSVNLAAQADGDYAVR